VLTAPADYLKGMGNDIGALISNDFIVDYLQTFVLVTG
jgi:hypothetical protein